MDKLEMLAKTLTHNYCQSNPRGTWHEKEKGKCKFCGWMAQPEDGK